MSYRLEQLEQKRERDEERASEWYRKPIREFKTDPGWFWLNVFFVFYIVGSCVVLAGLFYEMFFGRLRLLSL